MKYLCRVRRCNVSSVIFEFKKSQCRSYSYQSALPRAYYNNEQLCMQQSFAKVRILIGPYTWRHLTKPIFRQSLVKKYSH